MADQKEVLLDLEPPDTGLYGTLCVYADCKWYGKDVQVTRVDEDSPSDGNKETYHGQVALYSSISDTCAVIFPLIRTSSSTPPPTYRVTLCGVKGVQPRLVTVFGGAVVHCILTEDA